MCFRDTDGTQSVSLVFSCTKEDKGVEEEKLEQSAFVTTERHIVVLYLSLRITYCTLSTKVKKAVSFSIVMAGCSI